MSAEDYKVLEVTNAEDFFRLVDKYEIEIEGARSTEAPTLNSQGQYPVYLPYTRSVVRLNELFGEYLELNLQYWQHLLADRADFTLAYQSCDQLLVRMCQLLQSYFYSKSTTFTILQRAQFCTNLEYTLKSYHGYFKRSIFQTVNQGGYQVKDEV